MNRQDAMRLTIHPTKACPIYPNCISGYFSRISPLKPANRRTYFVKQISAPYDIPAKRLGVQE